MYIPIKTLWKRGDTLPEQAEINLRRGDTARFTFGGGWLPMWALKPLFGSDNKLEINESFNAAGYDITALEASYNRDDSVSVYLQCNNTPDEGGPTLAAVPIVAIIGGLGIIIGGVLIVAALSKVEAILKLPGVWIIGILVFIGMTGIGITATKTRAGP